MRVENSVERIFSGDSETAARWPAHLVSRLSSACDSAFPFSIVWGKEPLVYRNGSYRSCFGNTDPLESIYPEVLRSGVSISGIDRGFWISRRVPEEEVYLSFEVVPVLDDRGEVGGVQALVTETTDAVVSRRRLSLSRRLAGEVRRGRTLEETCAAIAKVLEGHPDLPFCAFYLRRGGELALERTAGDSGGARLPKTFPEKTGFADDGLRYFPISLSPSEPALGFWIVRPSRHRPFDDAEREFLASIATQLAVILSIPALEAANEAKSNFLSDLSHEIRTPLSGILGFSELLSESPLEETSREYLNHLRASGAHLLKLINNILDLSRIESGRLPVECVEVSFESLVNEAFQCTRVLARQKNIQAHLQLSPDVPPLIFSDPTRLRQIITNLLCNAIKFTEAGCVELRAGLEKIDGRDSIVVEVEDTGIGISPKTAAGLFRPFSQGDSTISRRFGGTGLGLMLSRRIAQALGGKVELKWSVEGKGSCFRLEIPCRTTQDAAADAGTERTAAVASSAEPALRGVKILLAEDSVDTAKLIDIFLKPTGIELAFARNGREAGKMALEKDFDLILMDMQMPEVDGLTATKILREEGYGKPIIAFTARALDQDIDEYMKAGFDGYVTKPVKRSNLLDAIRKHSRHDH